MATGGNWAAGSGVGLWHINFKINTPDRGFQDKFHVAEMSQGAVLSIAADLALRIRYMMPPDSEIFYATISKDDHKKDSRFVRDALGVGLLQVTGTPAVDTTYDFARTAMLIRFEHAGGSSISRKFAPIADEYTEEGDLTDPPDDIIGIPGALPAAPTVTTAFKTNLEGLMGAIMKQTHHVQSNHVPGGAYTYFAWENAFYLRVASKKGGRVFI